MSLAASASSQRVILPTIPELYDPNFLDVLLPPKSPQEKVVLLDDELTPSNAMMDALVETASRKFTENMANAYSSTLSPVLDAFVGISSYSFSDSIDGYLERAWKEDPAATLRLIWHLRSIHDGKSDRELFYRAFGWLYRFHPRTAISNLHHLVTPECKRPKVEAGSSHGYWKDLLNILVLAALEQLGPISNPPPYLHHVRDQWTWKGPEKKKITPEQHEANCRTGRIEGQRRRALNAMKSHEILEDKLESPRYRALYIAVARLFASQLVSDLQVLKTIENLPPDADRVPYYKQISLAGKWAPTPGLSHDRHTNIATAISMLLHNFALTSNDPVPGRFPSMLSSASGSEPVHVLRSFYRRWVLTPLRSAILVPETFMSANKWDKIRYNRVPSLCMAANSGSFFKHDQERFLQYLDDVSKGKKTISGATMLPHVLIHEILSAHQDAGTFALGSGKTIPAPDKGLNKKDMVKQYLARCKEEVAEGQWKSLVSRIRESGVLDSSLAICDVSGSMGSPYDACSKWSPQPILPALALSVLLSQLSKAPFANSVITFSENPQFFQLNPDKPVGQNVSKLLKSDWGMNTDFEAVFLKLLLPLALKHNLKQEDMIQRLFVFSDMQFDESRTSGDDWETNHDVIEREFKKHGYELPEIVYWNLNDDSSDLTTPVRGDKKGVALVSGFSPALLKDFMGDVDEEEDEEWQKVEGKADGEAMVIDSVASKEKVKMTPEEFMKKALGKKSFDGLVVVD